LKDEVGNAQEKDELCDNLQNIRLERKNVEAKGLKDQRTRNLPN
jgi:hypothetical protein